MDFLKLSYFTLLKNLGCIVFKEAKTGHIYEATKLGLSLKDKIEGIKSDNIDMKVDSILELTSAVLKFKREKPEIFEALIQVAEKIVYDCQNNEATKTALKESLK